MQKKCHRCGNFFTPIDGAIYCDKCSGTESPDSEPAETVDKYTIKTAREKTGLAKYRMAIELKIPATTYFTYEQKNYMPEAMLDKFAAFTGVPKDKIYCDVAKHSGGSRPHKKPVEKEKPVIKEKAQNMENTTKPVNTEVSTKEAKELVAKIKDAQEAVKSINTPDKQLCISRESADNVKLSIEKLIAMHKAISLAAEYGLANIYLSLALYVFDDLLNMHNQVVKDLYKKDKKVS